MGVPSADPGLIQACSVRLGIRLSALFLLEDPFNSLIDLGDYMALDLHALRGLYHNFRRSPFQCKEIAITVSGCVRLSRNLSR